jgi:N-acetylmuramic acid 6-phosphate etherase
LELEQLTTEERDSTIAPLETLGLPDRLRAMNAQDARVAAAVGAEIGNIARAVRKIVASLRRGGRLIYVGAGTSGRLGVLDASECPPTFGTSPDQVVGIIAGGFGALTRCVEGAEDDFNAGAVAVEGVSQLDTVVGLSASGRTPFVAGALERARQLGASTVAVVNNTHSELSKIAQVTIAPIVGPEVIAGSTRLKAGTSQQMVLNMLSTAAMVELGKTHDNLMVDVQATNEKLRARAIGIVRRVAGVDDQGAGQALDNAAGTAKLAIVMLKTGLGADQASELLAQSGGLLRKALGDGPRAS